jgi:hypothetical protein
VLTHTRWEHVPGLRHGFLDRHESARASGPHTIMTPRQVHGTLVLAATPGGPPPTADGLVTGTAGLLVGVVTADCVPLLLVAPRQRVAAAIHAGWRGMSAGILEAALGHLQASHGVGPGDIEAAIGPAVGPCCYEVGGEVLQAFRERSGDLTRAAWSTVRERLRLDLRHALRALLAEAGVEQATTLGPCTRCSPQYASYRRDGTAAGRQLSFVGFA